MSLSGSEKGQRSAPQAAPPQRSQFLGSALPSSTYLLNSVTLTYSNTSDSVTYSVMVMIMIDWTRGAIYSL
jgi:hypothetical protein